RRARDPAGADRLLASYLTHRLFRHVVDLDWWDKASIDGVTVTVVPARHAVPEDGYVVEGGRVPVYVATDTHYFPPSSTRGRSAWIRASSRDGAPGGADGGRRPARTRSAPGGNPIRVRTASAVDRVRP